MATITYTIDSRGQQINSSWTVKPGKSDARFYVFLPQGIVNSISTIAASLSINKVGVRSVAWFWSKVASNFNSTNSFVNQRVNNNSALQAQFDPDYPFLVARYGVQNNGSSNIKPNASGYTITATGTFLPLNTVNIGDKITTEQMIALQNYANKLATQYNQGTSITLTPPTANAPLDQTNWESLINKLNSTPHISGLTVPAENSIAYADYYNNIVSAMVPE